MPEEDFIHDGLGKRIRPDVSHPVDCEETMIEVQQRKDDGNIWISSNWLYNADCYSSGGGLRNDIYKALSEAVGGDEKFSRELNEKYEDAVYTNRYWFEKALERYFRGGKLNAKYWDRGCLFAASKEWRIKTLEQFKEALEDEKERFSKVQEEFIDWFRRNGLKLGEKVEEGLRRRSREFYDVYPCSIAKEWCELLVKEDKSDPSDIYLWWDGEPNSDCCYAFLTLYFELDPGNIGTSGFDDTVSRNLRALINIAGENSWLSSYREYEPHVWRSIFS